jgi:hypothetical protein
VPHLPDYIWTLVFIGVAGIPAATCAALYRGAIAAGARRRVAAATAATAGAALGGWVLASALLARAGAYRQDPAAARFWIPVALFGALAVALLAVRLPVMSRILADPGTPARLALPQTLRVVGVAFLIVMALHRLPAVFALPAGLGDIAVGLSAPLVARRLATGRHLDGAVWFNVLGLLDLVVAVTIGFLAGLGPGRLLVVAPSTAALGLLPLALIPTTAVPLAAALHVLSLRRLSVAARPVTAPRRHPAPAAG